MTYYHNYHTSPKKIIPACHKVCSLLFMIMMIGHHILKSTDCSQNRKYQIRFHYNMMSDIIETTVMFLIIKKKKTVNKKVFCNINILYFNILI